MNTPKIELGDRVRDRITKFTGIVVCKSEWVNGCVRLGVQKEEEKGSDFEKGLQTFDIQQLEFLETDPTGVRASAMAFNERPAAAEQPAAPSESPKASRRPGGPRPNPVLGMETPAAR